MKAVLSILALVSSVAFAEEQTCAIKGMHCTGCTEQMEGKVCVPDKYETCKATITDEKKEMGQIHLVTKDTKEKIDMKKLKAVVKDAGYSLEKCTAGKKKS